MNYVKADYVIENLDYAIQQAKESELDVDMYLQMHLIMQLQAMTEQLAEIKSVLKLANNIEQFDVDEETYKRK